MFKHNLASLYKDTKKVDQAERLWLPAVAGAIKRLSYSHPETRKYLRGLADLYEQSGKAEKAEPLLRQQLD